MWNSGIVTHLYKLWIRISQESLDNHISWHSCWHIKSFSFKSRLPKLIHYSVYELRITQLWLPPSHACVLDVLSLFYIPVVFVFWVLAVDSHWSATYTLSICYVVLNFEVWMRTHSQSQLLFTCSHHMSRTSTFSPCDTISCVSRCGVWQRSCSPSHTVSFPWGKTPETKRASLPSAPGQSSASVCSIVRQSNLIQSFGFLTLPCIF